MQIKMRNGNVALEELNSNEKTQGGIYIPTTVVRKGSLRYGKILETGPGELVQGVYLKMDVEKGQEVIFDASRTETIEVDGKKMTICNMVDIIAIVDSRDADIKRLSIVPPPEGPPTIA